jgi:hypothetical protein
MRPVVDLETARDVWADYLRLEDVLLSPDDYIYFVEWKVGRKSNRVVCTSVEDAESKAHKVSGTIRRTKKKSAYRKMAVFFGLTFPSRGQSVDIEIKELTSGIVKIERGNGYVMTTYMDTGPTFSTQKVECSVEVRAPNGRLVTGYGACSSEERGFTHHDHDIPATAFTRALNRAISDMIGMGDVSAEEIQGQYNDDQESISNASPDTKSEDNGRKGRDGGPPRNVGELISESVKLGVTLEDIMEILQIDGLGEIDDYADAFSKVEDHVRNK